MLGGSPIPGTVSGAGPAEVAAVSGGARMVSEQESRKVAEAARDAAKEKLREVKDQFKQKAVLLRDVLKQAAAVANADKQYEESLLSFWNAKAEFEKTLGEE